MCALNCFEHFGYDTSKYVEEYNKIDIIDLLKKMSDDYKIGIHLSNNTYNKYNHIIDGQIFTVKKGDINESLITGRSSENSIKRFYQISVSSDLDIINVIYSKKIKLLLDYQSKHVCLLDHQSIKNEYTVFNDKDFYRSKTGEIININRSEKIVIEKTFSQARKEIDKNKF